MGVAEILLRVEQLTAEEKNELIVQLVEKMSVLNLSALVRTVETKFDVKAATSAVVLPSTTTPDTKVENVERTDLTVFLRDAGTKKIAVIKTLRELTGLGLKESKDLVDGAPTVVRPNVPKSDAESWKKLLEDAGAIVELR